MEAFTPDDNGSSSTIGKLAFGKNEKDEVQEWYILGKDVGVEGDNTVLFATDPIATQQLFNEGNWQIDSKDYDPDWGCAYIDNDPEPETVFQSHYGGSNVRAKLNAIAKENFTPAEQDLMNETTVKSYDLKADAYYTTTDKLYALTADDNNTTIIRAGTGDQIALALEPFWERYVHNENYKTDRTFWLRTCRDIQTWAFYVCVADMMTSKRVISSAYYNKNALVPAFNLNLSSVVFASIAKAASSGTTEFGWMTRGDSYSRMTLRMDGSHKKIGTVVYDEAAGITVCR